MRLPKFMQSAKLPPGRIVVDRAALERMSLREFQAAEQQLVTIPSETLRVRAEDYDATRALLDNRARRNPLDEELRRGKPAARAPIVTTPKKRRISLTDE